MVAVITWVWAVSVIIIWDGVDIYSIIYLWRLWMGEEINLCIG